MKHSFFSWDKDKDKERKSMRTLLRFHFPTHDEAEGDKRIFNLYVLQGNVLFNFYDLVFVLKQELASM